MELETERRLMALENEVKSIVDWKEEQKQMQKDQVKEHRTQTRWIITIGVTIVLGLLAIYFK